MRTRVRPGTVTKKITLIDGQNVVYVQHVLEGFGGRMPLGHHAILDVDKDEGSVHLATSPIKFGLTYPDTPGLTAYGRCHSAVPDKKFKSLSRIPLVRSQKKWGDFSTLPGRRGFTDRLVAFNKSARTPAWTTLSYDKEGFVWFSLKDPAVLPTTMIWISNRGRQGPPWNGRNCCLGLEDICGFFDMGLGPSVRPNSLSAAGIATSVKLSPSRPSVINYIEGVVKVPRGFRKVKSIKFDAGRLTFISTTGKRAKADVNHEFLKTGRDM